MEQAEEIPGYYWKGYVIEKNNKEYHDLSEPLIRMDRFLMIFIAAICVCGVIILGLILIMWTRNRLHEAGIGCGIVTVSTLLASVRIFRMEPKEILSMD